MIEILLHYILSPILVLGVVIFVHEIGHFCIARYFGVPTPLFSIGFGPEICGRTDRYGTRWRLSLFPVGGYVSIQEKETDPLTQRVLIASAGPLANFLFSIVLMILVYAWFGAPSTPGTIVAVNINAGAFEAGIRPNDKLLSLDGKPLPHHMKEITDLINQSDSHFLSAVVDREGALLKIKIPLREIDKRNDFGQKYQKKMLGVVFAGQNLKISAIHQVNKMNTDGKEDLVRAELIRHFGKTVIINFGKGEEREDFLVYVDKNLNTGFLDPDSRFYSSLVLWDQRKSDFDSLSVGQILYQSFNIVYEGCKKTLGVLYQILVGQKKSDELGGIVSISTMAADVSQRIQDVGFFYFFKLIALLSVNIGLINLLPLPMLDGGHLAFYAVEGIRGKPPSPKVKGYIYGVGIMFIIFISVLVNFQDILKEILPRFSKFF
ncbi:MAG: RIP metalloprotease RseP [Alphaproteobacteria bacterium]|nr:RIP metalloprotease RseP [Alphaproteobacteria bacterium]